VIAICKVSELLTLLHAEARRERKKGKLTLLSVPSSSARKAAADLEGLFFFDFGAEVELPFTVAGAAAGTGLEGRSLRSWERDAMTS
jgi:hypothetical protein